MRAAFNFHQSTGLRPGFGPFKEWYGTGLVLGLRMWWSAITFTVMWKKPKKAKKAE